MFARALSSIGLFVSLAGVAILLITAQALGATEHRQKLRTYREWKSEKIHSSLDKIRTLRFRIMHAKELHNPEEKLALEQDLGQEEWRLNIAKELTIKDYMTLHVAPLSASQRLRFQDIAARMSKAEVAEILETYVRMIAPSQANLPHLRTQAFTNDR